MPPPPLYSVIRAEGLSAAMSSGAPLPSPRRSPRLESIPRARVVTKEEATAVGEPPKLYSFKTMEARGPTSEPAVWFKKMTGQEWDGGYEEQSRSYEKQRLRWKGLMGANERRVKQRQESFDQTQAANEYMRQKRQREEDEAEEAEWLEREERRQRTREWWASSDAESKKKAAERERMEATKRDAAGGCICIECGGGCVAAGCYTCECRGQCTGPKAEVLPHWKREPHCVMCKVWRKYSTAEYRAFHVLPTELNPGYPYGTSMLCKQRMASLTGRSILLPARSASFVAQPSETMLAWGRKQGLQPPPYPIAGIRVPVRRNSQEGRSTSTNKHIGDYVNGHSYRKLKDSNHDDFIVYVPVQAFFKEGCHRWNEHSLHHCEEPGLRHGINERPILDLGASELVEGSKASRVAVANAREVARQNMEGSV